MYILFASIAGAFIGTGLFHVVFATSLTTKAINLLLLLAGLFMLTAVLI